MPVTSGLVLAAGAGRRFHAGPKQLALFRGRPLIEWAVGAQNGVAELERVVVVLGAGANEILATADLGRADPVICENWEVGRSASLRTGMLALGGSTVVIVTLGDQPLVTSDIIRRFVGEPPGTRAVYNGRPAHPVVLGRRHVSAVNALNGDRGASLLLRGGREIECSAVAPGGQYDVDTVADLAGLSRIQTQAAPPRFSPQHGCDLVPPAPRSITATGLDT